MRKVVFFFIILLLGIVGCSQNDVASIDLSNPPVIEERVGDDLSSDYEVINEIRDEELVEKVIDILKNASWEENVDVSMVHESDYKINKNFQIWITPKGNMLEIVHTEKSYYVRLSEGQSSKLFQIMTGKEL